MEHERVWPDSTNINRWIFLHESSDGFDTLSNTIKQSWQRSLESGIDYDTVLPVKLAEKDFDEVRIKNRHLCDSAKKIIDRHMSQSTLRDFGIILFSNEGHILHLYGDESFHAWATKSGIAEGTIWDEKVVGTNIFSVGIRKDNGTMLNGSECFSRFLVSANYYFSKIELEDGGLVGGLALVTHPSVFDLFATHMVVTIARSVEQQLFLNSFINIYSSISDTDDRIVLDQSTGANIIVSIGNNVLRMLNCSVIDSNYNRLEAIVEPLPDNSKFWSIINSQKKVTNETVQISLKRKKITVKVSTSVYKEKKVSLSGLVIYFDYINVGTKKNVIAEGHIAKTYFQHIVGNSPQIKKVIQQSQNCAMSNSNVLIMGESGVGKDLLSQAIHNASERNKNPYVALNCSSFSKELITSDLFGYEEGSFTGAKKGGGIGKFELADTGTLFLDEIGDMPIELQSILLRVLDTATFTRVGGNSLINVDVRIIAATNRNLYQKVAQGLFRNDLLYRLSVVRIEIPPLRDRPEDVIALAQHFMRIHSRQNGYKEIALTRDAQKILTEYQWPGNVRELKNMLEGIISTSEKQFIDSDDILYYQNTFSDLSNPESISSFEHIPQSNLYGSFMDDECEKIEKALRVNNGNRIKAAEYLGMSRATFYRRMKQCRIPDKFTK